MWERCDGSYTLKRLTVEQGKVVIGVGGHPGRIYSNSLEGCKDLISTRENEVGGREWMNVVIESVNVPTDWKYGGKGMGSRLHFEPALIRRDRDTRMIHFEKKMHCDRLYMAQYRWDHC